MLGGGGGYELVYVWVCGLFVSFDVCTVCGRGCVARFKFGFACVLLSVCMCVSVYVYERAKSLSGSDFLSVCLSVCIRIRIFKCMHFSPIYP